MITNIIDRRSNEHRWKRVQAIVEATQNDNSVKNADQAKPCDPEDRILYDERDGLSIAEAVKWASGMPCEVTLYLYDEGAN